MLAIAAWRIHRGSNNAFDSWAEYDRHSALRIRRRVWSAVSTALLIVVLFVALMVVANSVT